MVNFDCADRVEVNIEKRISNKQMPVMLLLVEFIVVVVILAFLVL